MRSTDPMIFPIKKSSETKKDAPINSYNDLIKKLDQLDKKIDGAFKSSFSTQKEQWTPLIKSTNVSGPITYNHQIGWVYRQGLLVDVWGDISWTNSGLSSGNLYVELPYKVATSTQWPFVGSAQLVGVTFGVGHTAVVSLAVPGTYVCEFSSYGNVGGSFTAVQIPNSGAIRFHIRYIGVQNE